MITHINHISLPNPSQLLDHIRGITTTPWRPHTQGCTVTYELRDWPDYRLMEGRIVPSHSDGIAGYRPLLILQNPGYIFRGCAGSKTQAFSAQRPGHVLVLDIDVQHEVWGDPMGDKGPWSALVWGPAGCPCLKEAWGVERVGEVAKEQFVEFLGTARNGCL